MKKYFLFVYFVFLLLATLPLTCLFIHIFAQIRKRTKYWQGGPNEMAELWARFFFSVMPGWHIEILGRENLVPKNQTVIFVANHQSMADVFMMYLLGHHFSFIAKESVFKFPIMGPTATVLRNVPLKRGDRKSAETVLNRCEELLREGMSVFLYPEGTRSTTGELLPFKPGAFHLSKKLGIPIQPLAVMGAKDLLRKGSFFPNSANATITILPLIFPTENISVEEMATSAREIISRKLASTTSDTPVA